jgi:hypothetical protein
MRHLKSSAVDARVVGSRAFRYRLGSLDVLADDIRERLVDIFDQIAKPFRELLGILGEGD